MRLTVYIPNYNHGKTLARAIRSAVDQDGIDEVVVIDDCSTDGSLEICKACAVLFPKFRFVRHAEKSERWEKAAAGVFQTFTGTHIVGLGADDFLLPNYAETIRRHHDAPAIFPSYYMVHDGSTSAFARVDVAPEETIATADQAADWLADPTKNARETGIGAAIRRDCIEWLCAHRYWECGPWCDAIGYSAVACTFGAVYLPDILAGFSHNPAGYGGRERDGGRSRLFKEAARDFLGRACIDIDATEELLRKRGASDPAT